MNVKLLLVLTIVLSAFCVLPVNAEFFGAYGNNPQIVETVYNQNSVDVLVCPHYYATDQRWVLYVGSSINNVSCAGYYQNGEYNYGTTGSFATIRNPSYNVGSNTVELILNDYNPTTHTTTDINVGSITFVNTENIKPDFDIIIEDNENIIELGSINDLHKQFTIGSLFSGTITAYHSFTSLNCTINDIDISAIDVTLEENNNYARINLIGDVSYTSSTAGFNTHALIYYNYNPVIEPTIQPTAQPTDQPVYPNRITGYIQTFDYQSGNMISGVNMSVYEVIDHDTYAELGTKIYSSVNAESQTILQLKNNTDYFVKNELTGYFAVKNQNYPYINNEYGYVWTPSINNPLILYYNRLDPNAQYNANFIVQDVNNNGISGVSVTMDNTITKVSNSIGGLSFSNVSAGSHTFTFVKNGYQSAQRTIDIQMQYATFTQTLFKDNQIVQPTVQPTGYPTIQPTVQPTISPIEKPSNIAESVKYGLSKIFGVNSLDTINLVFALMLILFPAVIGGVITNQALGFIAGGMMGFVFALAIGLIPIWVFFAMVMFSVIYLILTHGTGEGF